MKTVDDIVKNAHVLTIPMITRFRSISQREVLVFEGPFGWGEFGPFPEYSEQEAIPWLESAIEAAYYGFADFRRDKVEVNLTVPAVPATEVAEILGRYCVGSNPTVKIKVADGLRERSRGSGPSDPVFYEVLRRDIKRLEAIVRYVEGVGGTSLKFRVDSNGAWTYDQAVIALEALSDLAEREHIVFEYAEQPVSDIKDMIRLKRYFARSGVVLAIDENIRKDFVREARRGAEEAVCQMARMKHAADVMIIKNAPLGGNTRAIEFAEMVGLPAVVSSALDTGIGLYAAARLAAALEKLQYACGLNTNVLFREGVTSWEMAVTDGVLDIPPHGPTPDMGKLKKYRAGDDRKKWWIERLRKVFDCGVREAGYGR